MSWTNYHSHCSYCDGKMSPEAYVKAALDENVKVYGFSSHCPVPFENAWSIRDENFSSYLQEIEFLKNKYEDQLEIYKSFEIDYIPGMISPTSEMIQNADLDYTIGSVHFVGAYKNEMPWEIDGTPQAFKKGLLEIYNNDIRAAVAKYFELTRKMVETACPDIVGHLDKIKMHNNTEPFFDENEKWYQDEIGKTLDVIRAEDAIVEVNTRGIYKKKTAEPYPGRFALYLMRDMEIPICLNSDAHHPSEIISEFSNTANLLKNMGFKTMRIFHQYEWVDVEFDEKGVKI